MDFEWYLVREGQQYGPLSDADLRLMAARGDLVRTDFLWREGFEQWVEASQVSGLLPSPTRTPPPPSALRSSPAYTYANTAPSQAGTSDGRHAALVYPEDGGLADADTTTPLLAYVFLIIPVVLLPLIGVVIAITQRAGAPQWLKTHYRWQIRTFAIGLLYLFMAALLSVVVIGVLVLIFTVVWHIVRIVKGISLLTQRRPIDNVTTWLW